MSTSLETCVHATLRARNFRVKLGSVSGLREQKKQATREALGAAALRLALARGPENVRVDDIAEAAGVSPRTYNNYFSSREQAIVAAVIADRAERIADAVIAHPTDATLAEAVIEAVVTEYAEPRKHQVETILMITSSPALRACYVDTAASIERALTEAIVERCGHRGRRRSRGRGADPLVAEVLAVSVAAAAKVALRQWLQPSGVPGLAVVSGSLPDLLRRALAPLAPALEAAG
jgi:AcrR family transcriptional regulator